MPDIPNGVYDDRPWNRSADWTYLRPFSSNEERLTQQALESALVPGQFLADMVRPPLDQVQPFRPRFGYRTRALGPQDIIDIDRVVPVPRQDLTGEWSGFSGTSRNTQGTGTW